MVFILLLSALYYCIQIILKINISSNRLVSSLYNIIILFGLFTLSNYLPTDNKLLLINSWLILIILIRDF